MRPRQSDPTGPPATARQPSARMLQMRFSAQGRGFLLSGAVLTIAGVLLAERDVFRIGLLLLALPWAARLLLSGNRGDIRAVRTISPGHVPVGSTATVRVELSNPSRRSSTLLVEDRLPSSLGGTRRFLVDPIATGTRRAISFDVSPTRRGLQHLDSVDVRERDPFGMTESITHAPCPGDLLVLPATVPLPVLRLSQGRDGSGDNRPRSFSVGRVADVVVREYRHGDDLRRVHWPSTARVGELMVRNEEEMWQSRATIVLDSRSVAHRGSAPASSFEQAISVAASVARHLGERGYVVDLITADRQTSSWQDGTGPVDVFPLMQTLAQLELSSHDRLPEIPLTDERGGATVIAILGLTATAEREWWGRFPRYGGDAIALPLRVGDWEDDPPEPEGFGWLSAQGWRVAPVTADADIAVVWQGLER